MTSHRGAVPAGRGVTRREVLRRTGGVEPPGHGPSTEDAVLDRWKALVEVSRNAETDRFLDFFASDGMALGGFVAALFVNGAAGGFTADLLITSMVFWIYMFNRNDGPAAWPFVLINLTIGLSCALPGYLYLMGRRQGHPSLAS